MENPTRNSNSPESKALPEHRETSITASEGFGKSTSAPPNPTAPHTDHAAALGHDAVNKVSQGIRTTEQWITRRKDPRVSRPGKAMANTRQYVVSHPWQSIGVAAAFVLFLARRRSFARIS